MDLNTKIIEAVRQCPCLHGNNNSLEERNRAWQKLAEKLKMQEQHLKIRWHSLVQRYQSDDNFKYAHKMQFVERNTTHEHEQVGNWPEFVITEEDLQERPQQDDEDYVFMELDEFENTKEIKREPGQENQYKTNRQDIQIKDVKSLKIPNNRQDIENKSSNMVIHSVETLSNHSLPSESDEKMRNVGPTKIVNSKSITGLETKNLEPKQIKFIQVQPSIVKPKKDEPKKEEPKKEEPKKEEPKREETKKDEPKKVEPPPAIRCEDDIFGELVSAMLKRMDETKKKNVKKEIMNLLLT